MARANDWTSKVMALINGQNGDEPIDAHGVQPYYALLLAREAGLSVRLEQGEEEVTFRIEPLAQDREADRSVEIDASR